MLPAWRTLFLVICSTFLSLPHVCLADALEDLSILTGKTVKPEFYFLFHSIIPKRYVQEYFF